MPIQSLLLGLSHGAYTSSICLVLDSPDVCKAPQLSGFAGVRAPLWVQVAAFGKFEASPDIGAPGWAGWPDRRSHTPCVCVLSCARCCGSPTKDSGPARSSPLPVHTTFLFLLSCSASNSDRSCCFCSCSSSPANFPTLDMLIFDLHFDYALSSEHDLIRLTPICNPQRFQCLTVYSR